MTSNGLFQILVYFVIIALATKPFGVYMARLFAGERTVLHPLLHPLESLCYRLAGVAERQEQHWTQYAASVLSFSFASFLFVYLFQRLEGILPLNPAGFDTTVMTPDLAFNTAVSFITNTNWQAYSGEATMSYLVQMAAL
ncbi:MAG: potassium-transporting ATPase subunit KdpA, partial [Acidobacteria bacterium]|nr:potassium-transporting ATPase subunit KdpA [Acidobacteriota bacterium]